MINEEILAGLKYALERGQSLQRAMATLYNSGYRKEEIEEAARNLIEFKNENQFQSPAKEIPRTPVKPIRQMPLATQPPKSFQELESYMPPPAPSIAPSQLQLESQEKNKGFFQKLFGGLKKKKTEKPTIVPEAKPITVQKVSSYEYLEENRSKEKTIIFVMVFLLVFLFALLGVIFLFKEQLIDFFSSLFS